MDTAQIRAILGDAVQEDGRIARHADDQGFIEYQPGSRNVWVLGDFTADELFAIAAHMRAHTPPIDTTPAPAQTTTNP